MGLLDGRVALVSGAGPNLGRQIARAFAREGATVVVGARTEANVAALVDEIAADGGRAQGLTLDICDPDSCRRALDRVTGDHGRLDVLVNNAFHPGDMQRFADADLAVWRQVVDVNLFGTLQLTQAALPALRAAGEGRVIMINTMSSVRIQPNYGAYAASKAALAAVTKTLALELGADGIRVNAVHPGYIYGDQVKMYFEWLAQDKGITPDEQYAEVAAETALGYLPDAAEIAETVVFLASDMARPLSGQAIGVNAGHFFQGF